MNLRVYNLLLTLIGLTILFYLLPKTEGFLEVGNPSKGLVEFFFIHSSVCNETWFKFGVGTC